MRMCVCVCVCACVRACVRTCVRVYKTTPTYIRLAGICNAVLNSTVSERVCVYVYMPACV